MANPVELVGGIAIGTGVGAAVGATVTPKLQEYLNEQWAKYPNRPPSVGTLASGVAQGQVPYDDALAWAQSTGFDKPQFDALVNIANTGPGVAVAFDLWRRKETNEAGFRRAAKRQGLEQEWIDDLVGLHDVLLSVSDVANAVQQGHVPNDGILPDISAAVHPVQGQAAPDTPDGQPPSHVPLTQIGLDPVAEASGHGWTRERLQVLANLVGLPPGPEALLTMWNRGLIDEDSVDAGIREGHMKTKWTGAFKRMRWAVLSGQEYAEARLRDWITDAQMYAGGALTGHTKEQMDLFYKNRGRTATPRQVWLGWARKVPAPDYPGDLADGRLTGLKDHELAIRRSNIRPEYAKLLWDVRFNYPPLFQLTRLVQSGAIDADQAKTWADYQIYAPEVTAALHTYWLTLGGSGVNAIVKSEQTRLRTATHRSYIAQESDDAAATDALTAAGLDAATIAEVLTLWQHERGLIRAQLSPSDVRKAYQQGDTNAATGAQWTRDEAYTALLDRGWGSENANDYLNIPYKG